MTMLNSKYRNRSRHPCLYRTWENFGWGKFWRIWRMVGNSPKFSPPIFINARIFNILTTDSPNFSSPKTLEPLIRQNFPPPKFSHVRYIAERFLVLQKCYITYVKCAVVICLTCPHSPSGAAHPRDHAYISGKSLLPMLHI